jgi:hypothetical protein
MELEPLMAIFCINVAVENKSRRLRLNTSSCSRLTLNALSFFNLNFICIVLCFEHVKSWLCELSKLFLLYLW